MSNLSKQNHREQTDQNLPVGQEVNDSILPDTADLLKTKNWFQMVLNSISDGFVVLDSEFRFVYIGQVDATRFAAYGLDAKRMLGKAVWQMMSNLADSEVAHMLRRVMVRRQPATCEQKVGDRWYEMHAYPNADGGVVILTPDITERKQSQDKLHHLDVLTENIADAVISTDEFFHIISWNKGAENIYGWKKEEVVGQPVNEVLETAFFEAEKEERSRQELSKNLKWQGEVKQSHKEGHKIIVQASVAIIKNSIGKITGIMAINKDITEQRLAAIKLQDSEERLRISLEAAEMGIWDYNLVTNGVTASDKLKEMFGLSLDEPFSNEVFLQSIYADDYEPTKKITDKMNDVPYTGNRHYDHTYRIVRRSDNALRWLHSKGKIYVNKEGKAERFTGTVVDITREKMAAQELFRTQQALKESEIKFRQMADLVPQIIWTARPDGYVDYYNSRWYQFTGFEKNYGDNSWIPILHPDDVKHCLQSWYYSVKTGEPYSIEYRFKDRTDNSFRWFLGKGLPIRDSEGCITKWFGTCTDIHDQKTMSSLLEKLVQERTEALHRSNEDLQQFAHVASHDLREPLRKIRMFSSRMNEEFKEQMPEKAVGYLDKINNAAHRMNTMIEGVLKYATAETWGQHFETIHLQSVLANIEADLEISISRKKAIISYQAIPPFEGALVLIHQLFYNLIYNSLKFSRENVSPVITIQCRLVAASEVNHIIPNASCNRYLHIEMQDNGIGFDLKHADVIFNTFTRLNSKDKFEGTGLGLALCRKIVQRHKGVIYATGIENKGATFFIILPEKQ